MPPSRSLVWNFYRKTSSITAECKVCEREVKYHGSTSNLREHLKRKHSEHLNLSQLTESFEEDGCKMDQSDPANPSSGATEDGGENSSCPRESVAGDETPTSKVKKFKKVKSKKILSEFLQFDNNLESQDHGDFHNDSHSQGVRIERVLTGKSAKNCYIINRNEGVQDSEKDVGKKLLRLASALLEQQKGELQKLEKVPQCEDYHFLMSLLPHFKDIAPLQKLSIRNKMLEAIIQVKSTQKDLSTTAVVIGTEEIHPEQTQTVETQDLQANPSCRGGIVTYNFNDD